MQPSRPRGIIHTVAEAFKNVAFIQSTVKTNTFFFFFFFMNLWFSSSLLPSGRFIAVRILADILFPVRPKGESGLGKSTLINSLFLTDLYPERIIPGAAGGTSAAFS